MLIVLLPYADLKQLSSKVIAQEHCVHVYGRYTLARLGDVLNTNVAPLDIDAKFPLPPAADPSVCEASATPGGLVFSLRMRVTKENTITFDHYSGNITF